MAVSLVVVAEDSMLPMQGPGFKPGQGTRCVHQLRVHTLQLKTQHEATKIQHS